MHQLRQRFGEVWEKAGRKDRLIRPVRRAAKSGEDPVDYAREGQLWQQILALAREAGAVDDGAAVELVLTRLEHAALLMKPVKQGSGWDRKPRVYTLSDFVGCFPECGEAPAKKPLGAQLGNYGGKDGTGDELTYEDIHGVKRDEEGES